MTGVIAEAKKIGNNFRFGQDSVVVARKVDVGDNVVIGRNVKLVGEMIKIGSNTEIENNVSIVSKNVVIGDECKFESGLFFSGFGTIFEKTLAEELVIGDNSFFGFGSRICVPILRAGDYCVFHNNISIYGPAPCTIGHNAWIGQETIINTRKAVAIGNNVRIGVRSQIWTHSASGELIEGTNLFSEKEVTIEDNAWLNGTVIISPGVRVKSWSVVLIGAVLTKDTEPYHLYAGVPAKDITDKIRPYNSLTLDEKYEIMRKLVDNFVSRYPKYSGRIFLFNEPNEVPSDIPQSEVIIIFKNAKDQFIIHNNSVFDISTKKYRKVRSRIEIDFIKMNVAHNARFIPI